jgi:hypothetical protein
MADKELLELTPAAVLTGAEVLMLVQGGNSRQAELTVRLLPWILGELGSSALLDVDLDGALAANSDALIASQKAVRTFVAAQIATLINSAPGTLDTLGEIAAALAANDGALAALTATVAGKLAKASNLSDLTDVPAARGNLGLGAAALLALADVDARARTAIHAVPSAIAGTAYTFVLGDAYGYKQTTNADATALTVPPNSAEPFAVGTVIAIRQKGAGLATLVAGGGVTLNSRGGLLASAGRHAGFQIKQVAIDEWDVWGDVA